MATDRWFDRDRGQLIIVAALVLAVVFVALALVLNSAIFTENVSTRETGDEGSLAVSVDDAFAETSVRLDYVNANHNDSEATVNRAFTTAMADWSSGIAATHASMGAAFGLTVDDRVNGSALKQTDEDRPFTSGGDETAWTLVSDASRLAGFELVVDRDDLDDGETVDDLRSDSFHLEFDDGTETWQLYVFDDGGSVTVFSGTESAVASASDLDDLDSCTTGADPARIDLSAGTLGGEPCAALEFESAVSEAVDVRYANADRVTGTYELFVADDGDAEVQSEHFGAFDDSPYEVAALYSVTVTVQLARDDVDHERTQPVFAADETYVVAA